PGRGRARRAGSGRASTAPPGRRRVRRLLPAFNDHEVVVDRIAGDGQHVRPLRVHASHRQVPGDEGDVLLVPSQEGAALEGTEGSPDDRPILGMGCDVDQQERSPARQDALDPLEYFGEGVVGDVVKAAVRHNEIEGTVAGDLVPRGYEDVPRVRPPRERDESVVDIVATLGQAGRREGAGEESGTASEVEDLASRREGQGLESATDAPPLLPFVERHGPLAEVVDQGPDHPPRVPPTATVTSYTVHAPSSYTAAKACGHCPSARAMIRWYGGSPPTWMPPRALPRPPPPPPPPPPP